MSFAWDRFTGLKALLQTMKAVKCMWRWSFDVNITTSRSSLCSLFSLGITHHAWKWGETQKLKAMCCSREQWRGHVHLMQAVRLLSAVNMWRAGLSDFNFSHLKNNCIIKDTNFNVTTQTNLNKQHLVFLLCAHKHALSIIIIMYYWWTSILGLVCVCVLEDE